MKIDKRKLLKMVIAQDLWEKISPEEMRLYLLLVISVDQAKGTGRLSREYLEKYLGHSLQGKQLQQAAHTFHRLHLVEMDYSLEKSEIKFRLFNNG